MPFSGRLDLVLRELESMDEAVTLLETADGEPAVVGDLQRRLSTSVETLTALVSGLLEQRDELRHALEHERERYRELFEFAPAVYLITDAEAVIEEANAAAAELLGVPPQRLLHKRLSAFVERDARPAFRRLLRDVAEGPTTHERELPFVARDGRRFAAGVTVGPVYDRDRIRALRWLIRDVSARKRAEDEVRWLAADLEDRVRTRTREVETERARLATVVEQLPAGVVIVDPNGVLVLANREAEVIWDESATVGTEWPLARTVATGDVVTGELLEIVRADGSPAILEVNAAPVRDRDGDLVAAVQVFWDVTARERQERAEREFVSNAAHELQTPLTAITSAAEVLQAGAKEIPEDRDRFLTHIQNECDRLARLVQALLVLARAQTGGEPVATERLRLRPLLEAVVDRVRPREGVRVQVECPARLTAVTNRELAEQAIINILANAAKFTSEGSIVLVGRRVDGDCVAIEVTDSGPGVPPEERARVFERFYRAGDRDRSGFGLGLAIADQTARALGGRVELESGRNGGTTVRMTLPAAGPS